MRIACACLVVVFSSLALVGTEAASASCLAPSTGFSPSTGTVLPANATVYLFVTQWDRQEPALSMPLPLQVDGAAFTARRIATMPEYDVVRIDLVASGQEVVLRWKPEHAYGVTEVRYPIGVPAADDPIVTDVAYTRNIWSCSYTETIDISVTGSAIAYRIDWSDGTSAVMPADLGVLWRHFERDRVAASSHRLALGHVSCLGYTVEPQALATLREFQLVALFVDGTERRFSPATAKLQGEDVRLPRELMHAATAESAPTPPPVAPRSYRKATAGQPRPMWPVVGALAGLAAAAVAGACWRFRRVLDQVPRT